MDFFDKVYPELKFRLNKKRCGRPEHPGSFIITDVSLVKVIKFEVKVHEGLKVLTFDLSDCQEPNSDAMLLVSYRMKIDSRWPNYGKVIDLDRYILTDGEHMAGVYKSCLVSYNDWAIGGSNNGLCWWEGAPSYQCICKFLNVDRL